MTNGEPTPGAGPGQGAGTPPPPPTPSTPGNGAKAPEDMTVGELVFEVSDRASLLVREEIELAKTEVTEKVNRLLRGSVAGLVAGIFALLALLLIMHGIAWLLNDLVFNNFWAGFFVEAAIFLLIGAGAGFFAYRAFQRGAPPTPDMAIEEAKEIKAAFGEEDTS
ncbi:MAG TPA: phage holin family protein [Solirubrobacterales bacterium]|nr:phage holin family protein [Solirubrobacterales bacterium]